MRGVIKDENTANYKIVVKSKKNLFALSVCTKLYLLGTTV